MIIKKILLAAMRILPLRRIIVFESHPDFSDNSLALYEEMLRRGVNERYRIYWMQTFHTEEQRERQLPANVDVIQMEPRTFREMIKRAYVLNCCRCLIDCNTFIYKRRKKQVRIHLGHGMPIKIDLEYSRKFGDCDKYMIQSAFWKDIYMTQIGVPESVLCDAGYPRNDVLVNRAPNECWKAAVRSFRKVLIWMPTYRQHMRHMERAMKNEYPYGMPVVHSLDELKQLEELLGKEDMLLLFRPHPVQELSVFKQYEFPHIVIADDHYLEKMGMTLYELLGNTDGLITDYSSVYFDYLLTGRPIALTIEDMESYFRYFTLAVSDYKTYIKGDYVETFQELLDFLTETAAGKDRYQKEREAARRRFHTDTSGVSAQRIADLLLYEYGIG